MSQIVQEFESHWEAAPYGDRLLAQFWFMSGAAVMSSLCVTGQVELTNLLEQIRRENEQIIASFGKRTGKT